MDRFSSMSVFVKSVEAGSFAATAAAMNISPQMVAKHIAYLEARMGARLLNRTTRRQGLTEIGRIYYDRCKVVLAELDWADAVANEAKGTPRGILRINAPLSYGTSVLTPLIAKYLQQYREVEVDLSLNDRIVDPIEEGYEVVFRIGPLAEGRINAIEVLPFCLVACASPAYIRKSSALRTPDDLADHDCLAYAQNPGRTLREWMFLRNDEVHLWRVSSRFRIDNAAALMEATLAGYGIALIAKGLAEKWLSNGALERVLVDYTTPFRTVHMITQPDRRPTSKLESFIRFMKGELSKGG